jgi:uncharacterized low-complexity protein
MNKQLKKLSFLTGAVLVAFLLTFTTTSDASSFEQTSDLVVEMGILSMVTPDGDDKLSAKCGSETEAKKSTKEGKCGESKSKETKSSMTKTSSTTETTGSSVKSTDAGKCGEGQCGEGKSKEAKSMTETSKKEAKSTSEGKCGGEGKCGMD